GVMSIGEERQEEPGRALTVYHDGIGIGRLNTLDEGIEHRSAGTHHTRGRVHDALEGVLDIGRGKRSPIVPLYPFMEVEGERFTPLTDLPRIGQFWDDLHG